MILQPHAEPARNDDHRLVGEAHAGRQWRGVALHQIGPLMDIKTDAVAGPVRQAGQAVARSETVRGQ